MFLPHLILWMFLDDFLDVIFGESAFLFLYPYAAHRVVQYGFCFFIHTAIHPTREDVVTNREFVFFSERDYFL